MRGSISFPLSFFLRLKTRRKIDFFPTILLNIPISHLFYGIQQSNQKEVGEGGECSTPIEMKEDSHTHTLGMSFNSITRNKNETIELKLKLKSE